MSELSERVREAFALGTRSLGLAERGSDDDQARMLAVAGGEFDPVEYLLDPHEGVRRLCVESLCTGVEDPEVQLLMAQHPEMVPSAVLALNKSLTPEALRHLTSTLGSREDSLLLWTLLRNPGFPQEAWDELPMSAVLEDAEARFHTWRGRRTDLVQALGRSWTGTTTELLDAVDALEDARAS